MTQLGKTGKKRARFCFRVCGWLVSVKVLATGSSWRSSRELAETSDGIICYVVHKRVFITVALLVSSKIRNQS